MPLETQTQHIERELPSPSAVVQRVLTLLNDDDVTMGALADALGADPALTGRVLRLANSAAFSKSAPVLALSDALQRLGVVAVRQVLVSFSLVDRYRQGHCAGFDYAGFWSESLATAVAARHLARQAKVLNPPDCFTLGLLARVGELGLATMYPQEYGTLHNEVRGASAERITAVERGLLATDRFALAGRLIRMWQIPDPLAAAVEGIGDPAAACVLGSDNLLRLCRLLQVCAELGQLFGRTTGAQRQLELPASLRRQCQVLDIPAATLIEALPTIEAEWRTWGSTLGLVLAGSAPPLVEALTLPAAKTGQAAADAAGAIAGTPGGTPAPPLPVEGSGASAGRSAGSALRQADVIAFPGAALDSGVTSRADQEALLAPERRESAGADGPRGLPPRALRDLQGRDGEAAGHSTLPATADAAVAVAPGLRILLAHPHLAATEGWARLMLSQGHQVQVADCGEQALAKLLAAPPEVVLCDLDLQRMDALALFRSVRSSRPGKQIYLIAMAPRDRSGALEAAFGAGVDDFIGYPLQAGELLARLRAAGRFIEMQDRLLEDQEQVRQLVNQLAKANARLEQESETDALTGIANRRRATDQLLRAVRLAEEENQPLGVFLVDLDHFKRVNDTWGHATGDEVLRQAARALQAYSRTADLVARFGGEEFLVIAPGTSAQTAAALAERLRAGVSHLRIAAGKEQIAITFSVGVSVYDPSTSPRRRTPEALLHMADEALYRAKESGRNRVCVAADRPAARRPGP